MVWQNHRVRAVRPRHRGCSLGVVLVRDIWHSALLLGARFQRRGALRDVAGGVRRNDADPGDVGGVLILITFAVMLTREDESVIEVTP